MSNCCPNISNLQEFTDYRTNCPFCFKTLELGCEFRHFLYSIGNSNHLNALSLKENKKNIIIEYDAHSNISSLISRYIRRIFLNKLSNQILFEEEKDTIFPPEDKLPVLSSNNIVFYRICNDCQFNYRIILYSIDLTNPEISSFKPEMYSERFKYFFNATSYVAVVNNYYYNKSFITVYVRNEDCILDIDYDKELPIINFNWSNKEDILQQVKLLLAFQ